MLNSNISGIFSHKYTKIKVYAVDDLPLQKMLNIQNEVILINTVFNENRNHYYHEKVLHCLYK